MKSNPLRVAQRQEGQPSWGLALPSPPGATWSSPLVPAGRPPWLRTAVYPRHIHMCSALTRARSGLDFTRLFSSAPHSRGTLWIRRSFPEESDCCPAEVRRPPQIFSEEKHVWPQRSPPVVAVTAGNRRGSQEESCLASTLPSTWARDSGVHVRGRQGPETVIPRCPCAADPVPGDPAEGTARPWGRPCSPGVT